MDFYLYKTYNCGDAIYAFCYTSALFLNKFILEITCAYIYIFICFCVKLLLRISYLKTKNVNAINI